LLGSRNGRRRKRPCRILAPGDKSRLPFYTSTQRLNRLIQSLKKCRSILSCERFRSLRVAPETAQMGQEIPRSQSIANVVFREGTTAVSNDLGAFRQASTRQGNVPRDHNVRLCHVCHDPVVRRIYASFNDPEFKPILLGRSHPGIGHQNDLHSVSLGYAIDLSFHGTRVCIDIDIQQRISSSQGTITSKQPKMA